MFCRNYILFLFSASIITIPKKGGEYQYRYGRKKIYTDDVATKIFTDKKDLNYTVRVISSALHMDFDYVKNNLTILNPKDSGNIHNKGTVVDAIQKQKDLHVKIEINYSYYEEGRIKNAVYITQLLLNQTKPRESYLKTVPNL